MPKSLVVTINAGMVPKESWVHDHSLGGGRILGEACHFIDLARHLVQSPIKDYDFVTMTNSPDGVDEDKVTITLSFKDGSIATVHYFANGSKAFAKERIEVFSGGKILQLDNFRALRGFGFKHFNTYRTWTQQKGQAECVELFVKSIKSGEQLIPLEELFEISEVTISIAEDIRAQA